MKEQDTISIDFIAGMSRAGTTLLLSILNTEDSTLCVPEIPISVYSYSSFKNKTNFSIKDAKIWLNLRLKMPSIRNIQVNENLLKKSIGGVKNYREFLILAYASIEFPTKNGNYSRIIDKDHIHTFQTELISKIFPDSKYILLLRHPMAYVNSSMEKPDDTTKLQSVNFYSYVWNEYAKKIIQLVKNDVQNRFLVVKYEDLVGQPESTLKEICSHLKITYSTQMLEFNNSKFNNLIVNEKLNSAQLERKRSKYNSLSQEINNVRIKSWENKLTKKEQNLIASITHDLALQLKYSIPESSDFKAQRDLFTRNKVKLYFKFSKYFYLLPIKLREVYKVKI